MALSEQELQELEFLKAEVAKISNPNRVTTREEAQRRAEEMDAGGLEAGPWYMEMAKELLNPVDMAAGSFKAVGRGAQAAGNAIKGAVKNTAGRALGSATERQGVIDLVNEGADLAPTAKGMIQETMQGITEKGIKPKDAALRELIQGKTGQINPDLVKETFPNYASKLAERRAPTTSIGSLGETIQTPGSSGPVEVPLQRLLRLKRASDSAAGYSKSAAPFQEAAASKNAAARQVADAARDQIYEQAPGSKEMLSSLGRDIKTKRYLGKKAESDPVGLLKSKPGTTKDSVLASADTTAGTDLRGYGDMIESAADLQMNPKNYLSFFGALPEARKAVTRGVIKAGSVVDPLAQYLGGTKAASTSANALGFGAAKYATDAMDDPAVKSGGWSAQDEEELQQLKSMLKDAR